MRANEPQTCTDCGSTEVEPCTVCKKPVCPEHRSGTGRLRDGYQCSQRDCWYVGYPGRTRRLPREHLSLEGLRAFVFRTAGVTEGMREHVEECELCHDMIERERAENPLCQPDEESPP